MSLITQIHHLKSITYREAWDFQTVLHNGIKTNKLSAAYRKITTKKLNHLVLCEHDPVFTIGKTGSRDHLLIGDAEISQQQYELYNINRGGDITYHGPGQMTGYLILDLEELYRDVKRYVHNLEETIIQLLADYGVKGFRIDDYTGVWVGTEDNLRKICAIGVHLSRWVTLHGFGFNVSTDLTHFDKIVPCGIADKNKSVTSLSQELGRPISVSEIQAPLVQKLSEVFDLEIINK